MDLNLERISEILDVPREDLEEIYRHWILNKKNKGKDPGVPDLKLLASLSGLSVSSVSNFLNNKKGSISRERAEVLEKLVEIVGYYPSNAAKKLRSSNKMSIGFVFSLTSGTSTEYYVNILRGLKREADKYGYFIDIYDISEDKRKEFFSDLPFMGMVDGLIVVASVVTSELLAPLVKRKIPVVLINPLAEERHRPVVSGIFSDSSAFIDLLNHLFDHHQYKNPMLISVNLNNSAQRTEKYRMFVEAAESNGIKISDDRNVTFISSHSSSEGSRAYRNAIEKNPDADVYVCLTDTLAVPVIRHLQQEGRKAAVSGYANFEIAELFELSTVEQNIPQLGIKAFQHLFFSIQYIQRHGQFPEYSEERIPSDFIRRQSCGCDSIH